MRRNELPKDSLKSLGKLLAKGYIAFYLKLITIASDYIEILTLKVVLTRRNFLFHDFVYFDFKHNFMLLLWTVIRHGARNVRRPNAKWAVDIVLLSSTTRAVWLKKYLYLLKILFVICLGKGKVFFPTLIYPSLIWRLEWTHLKGFYRFKVNLFRMRTWQMLLMTACCSMAAEIWRNNPLNRFLAKDRGANKIKTS